MARAIRIWSVVVALMVSTSAASAAPLALDAGWLNSTLTFGGPSFSDDGYDVNLVELYDVTIAEEGDPVDVWFGAGGGSLDSITALAGHTLYRYEGGTFFVQFAGALLPFFTAPIVSLEIDVFGDIEPGAGINVTYQLGPGLFDAAFAALHGVPTNTGTGLMLESLTLLDGGPQSEEITADDGGGDLMVEAPVPEPALSLLLGVGVAAALRRRFSPKP